MILSHSDGLEQIYKLRIKYSNEIELVCLNSEYCDTNKLLPKAQALFTQYPDQVVLKESEAHEEDMPFYEVSLFCDQDKIDYFSKLIEDLGLAVDIIHDNQDNWSPYK